MSASESPTVVRSRPVSAMMASARSRFAMVVKAPAVNGGSTGSERKMPPISVPFASCHSDRFAAATVADDRPPTAAKWNRAVSFVALLYVLDTKRLPS